MGYVPRSLLAAGIGFACVAAAALPARADTEIGLRYWYGMGDTGKTLYGFDGTTPVSRLTYSGLQTNSGEIYYRAGSAGLFLKGYAGIGRTGTGNLQDEDFPPGISPYSSTDSDQHDGKISYATIDVGRYFIGGKRTRLGAFLGYNYFNQDVSAYGCTQMATNPEVCTPTIDPSVLGITQSNKWNAFRVGVTGDINLGRLRLSGDAAYLPSANLNGTDAHWLRIGTDPGDFTGPVPEDGKGWGYQLEADLDYQVRGALEIGVGARYWHEQTKGDSHFENHIVGYSASSQAVDWQTTMWGITAHATFRF